jgi:hypothetical protein
LQHAYDQKNHANNTNSATNANNNNKIEKQEEPKQKKQKTKKQQHPEINEKQILLNEAISKLKQNTKQYAKSQLNWVKRLRNHTNIFKIETTNINEWKAKALENSFQIVRCFSQLQALKQSKMSTTNEQRNLIVETMKKMSCFLEQRQTETKEEWQKYDCEICEKQYNGSLEWEKHLKSKAHKSKKKNKKNEIKKVQEIKQTK